MDGLAIFPYFLAVLFLPVAFIYSSVGLGGIVVVAILFLSKKMLLF
jgi:hypothetical protein